jgi:hypothetical protein
LPTGRYAFFADRWEIAPAAVLTVMRPLPQAQDAGCMAAGCFRRRRQGPGLLCGEGGVEPYEPHGVRLIEFGDAFS